MEASSIAQRRIQNTAGYALVVVLVEFIVAGYRVIARQLAAFATARRQAQARRELHRLSDHYLRDIGIDRNQIDRLFR